jgi:hypothetical protein
MSSNLDAAPARSRHDVEVCHFRTKRIPDSDNTDDIDRRHGESPRTSPAVVVDNATGGDQADGNGRLSCSQCDVETIRHFSLSAGPQGGTTPVAST